MTEPWTFSGESAPLGPGGGIVTLVEGSSFSISGRGGEIVPGTPHGLFFRDTRFLSRFQIRVNGQPLEALSSATPDPFSAVFVLRTRPRPGRPDSPLLVFRHRYVGRGLREDITVRNYGEEPAFCSVELLLEADFADLFEVKEGLPSSGPPASVAIDEGTIVYAHRRGATRRGGRISFGQPPQHLVDDLATYEVIVPARGEWSTCVQLAPSIDGEEIEPRFRCGYPVERTTPNERLAKWRRQMPQIETPHDGLRAVLARSGEDLGALRIFDPDFPERTVVAAGAPWFMTLFGRDSLITSWMALLVDPELALGVLQTLARFQGNDVDPRNEEEPGRIVHEMRFGDAPSLSLGGGRAYYGSADATPLFVMLLGELRRWGLATEVVDQLLPHADRALQWIADFGDRDGDGYVEYQRATDRGLVNQGWKDSGDAVRFADGALAKAPVAICEVQGYVYAAYLARAHFATEAGDEVTAARYRAKATELKVAFNRDFWVDERGWFAMGLDEDKQPIDALASNMGHCLWTGIVDPDKASLVVEHLMGPSMFSGWGVRTLATTMTGYNPISYQCGSVWPHDNAIIAAGLVRYGFMDEAKRLVMAQLDAGISEGGRLPELFSGLDRAELPSLVSYPTSCSPQAWASAAPLLMLRSLLRFDPWIPHRKVWLAPDLPDELGEIRVGRIPLAGVRVSIEVANGNTKIEGLPAEIEVISSPRDPLTAT